MSFGRLGDDLPLPLADHAARVQVGAFRGEELHHLGLALRGRPHQRRLTAPGFLGVDVGAGLEQESGRVHLARPRHRHQRRLALRSPRVWIASGLEQRANHGSRADDGGLGHRRRAELILRLDVGASLDEGAHQLQVVVGGRVHDGGAAIRPGSVWIGALAQQTQGGRSIATLGHIDQRRLGRRRQ